MSKSSTLGIRECHFEFTRVADNQKFYHTISKDPIAYIFSSNFDCLKHESRIYVLTESGHYYCLSYNFMESKIVKVQEYSYIHEIVLGTSVKKVEAYDDFPICLLLENDKIVYIETTDSNERADTLNNEKLVCDYIVVN